MFQLVAALLLFVSCVSPAALAVTLTSDQAQNSALFPPQKTGESLTGSTMRLIPGGGKGRHLLSVTASTGTQLADSTLHNGSKAMGVRRYLPGGGKGRLLLTKSKADLPAPAPLSDSLAPRRLLPGSGPGKRGDITGKHLLSTHESTHESTHGSTHGSTHESTLFSSTLQQSKGLTAGPIARSTAQHRPCTWGLSSSLSYHPLAAGRMLPGGGKGKHLLSTAPTTLSTSSGAIHQTAGTGHHQQDGLVLSAGRMLPGGGKGKHLLASLALSPTASGAANRQQHSLLAQLPSTSSRTPVHRVWS